MGDRPGWSKKNTTFEFETCAICKDGTDVGNIYGCVTWGFDVDASHKLKSHYLMKWDSPSAEFSKSVEQWNAQAKKPEAKRNDPDQQPLGPFK
jgi:hypothetical protein